MHCTLTDWIQVVLLAVNAGLVYWYVKVTQGIHRTSQAQLEAQIRPALVIRAYGTLRISNVGAGAAINLKLVQANAGDPIVWKNHQAGPETRLDGRAVASGGQSNEEDSGFPVDHFRSGQALHLLYESLSGKLYASVVQFNDGGPIRTTLAIKS
jgi:hypothetical protein